MKKLVNIQSELKAPKGNFNSFGKYKYRSCEDILEAVKPLLSKYKCVLILSDDIVQVGERYYIKATATLTDTETGESITNSALARESQEKKGMDDSQITGTASSYARKYALNGLFAIDDTKDADTDEFKIQQEEEKRYEKVKEEIITKTMQDALIMAIEKGNITDLEVEVILRKYGYTATNEIKNKDYKAICDELSKLKK